MLMIIFLFILILLFIFWIKLILKIIFWFILIVIVIVWLKLILIIFFWLKLRFVKMVWLIFFFIFINFDLLNLYLIWRRYCFNWVLFIYFWVYYCVYFLKIVWFWLKVLNCDWKFFSDYNFLLVSFDWIMLRCNVIVLFNCDEMCLVCKELF